MREFLGVKIILMAVLLMVILMIGISLIETDSQDNNSTRKNNNLADLFTEIYEYNQNVSRKQDEYKIEEILEILFYARASEIKGDISFNYDMYFSEDCNSTNVNVFKNKIKVAKEMMEYRKSKILWDTISIDFKEITIENDQATIKLTENYKYVIDNYDRGISSTAINYDIKMIKTNNKWLIFDITSDDEMDNFYLTEGFDVDEYIRKEVKNENFISDPENEKKYKEVQEFEKKLMENDSNSSK